MTTTKDQPDKESNENTEQRDLYRSGKHRDPLEDDAEKNSDKKPADRQKKGDQ